MGLDMEAIYEYIELEHVIHDSLKERVVIQDLILKNNFSSLKGNSLKF